jgi:hypothetical protein
MADKAFVDGSADEMIKRISSHMAAVIRERFSRALEASKNKHKSVEEGRAFVEAYVVYMHFVEKIHKAIMANESGRHETSIESGAKRKEHGED